MTFHKYKYIGCRDGALKQIMSAAAAQRSAFVQLDRSFVEQHQATLLALKCTGAADRAKNKTRGLASDQARV
jgi:hypothetical protein